MQQTADVIEEEVNAVTLGVGLYKEYGPGQEQEALKLFYPAGGGPPQRAAARQQQLDQPADQAPPTAAPPTP